MKEKNKAAYFFVSIIFTSCAHYSTTQQNIRKVNAAFEVKKSTETPSVPLTTPQQSGTDPNGSIPLSQFLDSKTANVMQSVNPWFSKVQEWANVYMAVAKEERDVRNYVLSEKYSATALMWAHRAIQIKDLQPSGALFKVRVWIEQLEFPSLPEPSAYYLAQDVYAKIFITRNIVKDFKNRFCLVARGVPIVATVAYLDLSVDLYRQKKYSKALYKIQNGLASVESIKPEEDEHCELPELLSEQQYGK